MRISRRTFFSRTGAGAAAVGALAAAPHLLGSQTRPALAAAGRPAGAGGAIATAPALASSEPVIAHVRDRATGEIALYVGTREIVTRDPELVSRLLQAGG